MGQKTNPIGFRLGVVRGWSSQWYSEKDFAKWLHEDLRLKRFVKEKLGHAGVAARVDLRPQIQPQPGRQRAADVIPLDRREVVVAKIRAARSRRRAA